MHSYELTAWSRTDTRQISVFWKMELVFIFVLWKIPADYSDSSCGGLCIDPSCFLSKPGCRYEFLNSHKQPEIKCCIHQADIIKLTCRNVLFSAVSMECSPQIKFCIRQRIIVTALVKIKCFHETVAYIISPSASFCESLTQMQTHHDIT